MKYTYKSLLTAGVLAISCIPGILKACDACNISFTQQLKNERAGSLMAKELMEAAERQKSLPLEGIRAAYLSEPDRPKTTPNASVAAATKPTAASVPALATATALAATPSAGTVPAQGSPAGSPPPAAGEQEIPEYYMNSEFLHIIQRDLSLPIPTTSAVPQDAVPDKSFTIRLHEGQTYIGNGVVYDGFLTNGQVPGPTIIVDEDDIVEIKVVNEGTIPHGASIHAADTQTSKYLGKINPGETGRVVFKAAQPGVYLYHCAPGGHAIPMHVMFGQYGMIVVKPKKKMYEMERLLGHEPDLELYLIQHELYASGYDAVNGNAAYVAYNGRLFRYVEDPIMVKPGDYVRIYYLNVGPNLLSTFHIVGIIWDFAYWQGHPDARLPGGQTVTAGPSDSWVIEFRVPPDEGAYTLLSHAVGSTSKGAIGLMVADRDAETQPVMLADGPSFNEREMDSYIRQATRIISPFKRGTHPADAPVIYGPETKEVHVSIIGNSYHPKVIQVAPGTTVTWTNEDVFTYMAGEYSGIHNVAVTNPPEDSDGIVSDLLAHGESFSYTFNDEWEYNYMCTPHPYMEGTVIVKEPEFASLAVDQVVGSTRINLWLLALIGLCFILSIAANLRRSSAKS